MNVCVLVVSVGWYLWVHGEKSPSSSLARRTSDELCALHDVDMFRLAVYNLTLVECSIMPINLVAMAWLSRFIESPMRCWRGGLSTV